VSAGAKILLNLRKFRICMANRSTDYTLRRPIFLLPLTNFLKPYFLESLLSIQSQVMVRFHGDRFTTCTRELPNGPPYVLYQNIIFFIRPINLTVIQNRSTVRSSSSHSDIQVKQIQINQARYDNSRTSEYPDSSQTRFFENRVSNQNLSLYHFIPSVQGWQTKTHTQYFRWIEGIESELWILLTCFIQCTKPVMNRPYMDIVHKEKCSYHQNGAAKKKISFDRPQIKCNSLSNSGFRKEQAPYIANVHVRLSAFAFWLQSLASEVLG
jgi:hypothetical protein